MHPLLAFYSETAPDDRGRRLVEILSRDDAWLEYTHDFIQWMFPLPETSGANPNAPILDDEVIAAFRASAALRDRLRASFHRMLSFYGLAERAGRIDKAANWDARKDDWFTAPTHNDLRITRIIRSLSLLGLRAEAAAFLACLRRLVASEEDCGVSEVALGYWGAALG